jgi:arylsulfatase A-like enzyme
VRVIRGSHRPSASQASGILFRERAGKSKRNSTVTTLLKIFSAAFFTMASIFCFAAFIPYTYLFLVKNPPYAWLAWFVLHTSLLYWCAFGAAVASVWQLRHSSMVRAALICQALVGVLFTYKNVLKNAEDAWPTYAWSIVLLLPMLIANLRAMMPETFDDESAVSRTLLPYSSAFAGALLGAALSIGGLLFRQYIQTRKLALHAKDGELAIFVVAIYAWLAVLLVSGWNAVQLIAGKRARRAQHAQLWSLYALVVVGVDVSIVRFLGDTLTVHAWYVRLYATVLAASIAGWAFVVLGPVLSGVQDGSVAQARLRRGLLYGMFLSVIIAAIVVPAWISSSDWNGLLEGAFNLVLLALLAATVGAISSRTRNYSVWAIAAAVLVSSVLYWTLSASGFLWAKDLGKTDDEVARTLQSYGGQNVAFGMLEGILSRSKRAPCGERCMTLRQYTNIINARAKAPLRLVDSLAPTQGFRPNIFIFVIDSLRPDYLGAYNPSADFSPSIDALARDSVVMRNAFTQYAGTSLSEPAIWSGALLLHSHFMRPFENVNSLLALGKIDGYEMIVSRDQILGKLLSADAGIVFLDVGKEYNEFEISDTLQQLEAYLTRRPDQRRPVMFYAQPMNLHVLGVNNLPKRTESNWRNRRGFNNNVAFKLQQVDTFLGQFVTFLKARGLYDSSIIIVTADHGDASPELPGFGFARQGHSTILFPEVMRVPLIIRLPAELRRRITYDQNRLAALTDITPSLYYLLGHRPIKRDAILGRPMFTASLAELHRYDREHLLLASDARAAYGILSGDLRTMYVTYDSPQVSILFDLARDPEGINNYLADSQKAQYDREIINDLEAIAAFYGYQPNGGASGQFTWDR